MRVRTLSSQLQIDLQPIIHRIGLVQYTVNTCCDFTSQCILVRINHSSCNYHSFYSPKFSKIYRCWIVWGQNIYIVIIPSFLAITLLGQSIYPHLMSRFQFIAFSYLDSVNFLWESHLCCELLAERRVYNRFGRVHGGEYPDDGHDRVQDPQGHGS